MISEGPTANYSIRRTEARRSAQTAFLGGGWLPPLMLPVAHQDDP